MTKATEKATASANLAKELRRELARKVALFIGATEKQTTSIPGLTLHRRTAATAPCSVTYEPGIVVIAQGRKQVNLGGNTFVYDSSRYLLTSVDLPLAIAPMMLRSPTSMALSGRRTLPASGGSGTEQRGEPGPAPA